MVFFYETIRKNDESLVLCIYRSRRLHFPPEVKVVIDLWRISVCRASPLLFRALFYGFVHPCLPYEGAMHKQADDKDNT